MEEQIKGSRLLPFKKAICRNLVIRRGMNKIFIKNTLLQKHQSQ